MKKDKLLRIHRFGFTLVESVIALAIFCSIVFATSLGVRNYQARVDEKQSMQQFKNVFKNTLNEAFLTQRYYNITISKSSHSALFKTNDDDSYKVRVKFPDTVNFLQSKSTIQIRRNGLIKPQTIKFHSDLTNINYVYVVQMNWGEIIDKT
ncbi:type II secretion system protein [Companilactobacillus keshanensis]|uniref:Prepilin-type N-terminal cleavage/methylation domain-containing protein n=1 Tax=Companilactobacillus keshanensis TaxID=2486003 RepID=A0ABW4BTF3_9LACO|nr:type II secretion system protein [Companilactobacillus keshanensis]